MSRSGVQPPGPEWGAAPIDWAQLDRAALGDAGLAREVLELFAAQAAACADAIGGLPPDAAAMAHKLKGSALGVGAGAVADAASLLEDVLATDADPRPAIGLLLSRIASAREAIAAHVRDA